METGELVICRTYSAGVEIGELVSRSGTEATLRHSRKLWRWRGANTLHEVATHGVSDDFTRLSEPVEIVVLTEVIEVLTVAPEAADNLRRSRWGQ